MYPLKDIDKSKIILLFIHIFAFSLYIVGINWGLPNTISWMADSLAPWDPLIGVSQAFSFGYFNKYPLVHQVILAVVDLPVVVYAVASHARSSGFDFYQFLYYVRSAEFATILIYIARFISVGMGIGTLYLFYKSVREVFGTKAGVWATALLSFNTVLIFYSHTAKVEVPHIFWAMAAIYYLIRVVKYHQRKDYIYTAVFSCLSIGTKDQAYAIFIIPFLVYLFVYPALTSKAENGIINSVFRKNNLVFIIVFFVGIILVENVLLNWEGLLYRFQHLTGDGGTRSIGYAMNPEGVYALWRDVFEAIMMDAMGLPVFAVSLLGAVLLFTEKKKRDGVLLLESIFLIAMLSFMVFFVQIIRQSSIRFVMIQSVLFTAYGGYALSRASAFITNRSFTLKTAFTVIVAAGASFSLYNAVSVNVTLLHDARYESESWMDNNIASGATIEYYTYLHYLPRFPEGTDAYRVKKDYFDIDKRRPDYLVLNSTMINKNLSMLNVKIENGHIVSERKSRSMKSGMPEFVQELIAGKLDYREVHRSELDTGIFRNHRALNISSEYIVIYQRNDIEESNKISCSISANSKRP